jgi:Family of unknown function (DUF6328)
MSTPSHGMALLVAPVAVHRLLFQRGRKRELVNVGHRLVVTGLVSLAATMLAGMLLVLDVVVGRAAAVSVAAALALVFTALWAGLPLCVRRGPVLAVATHTGEQHSVVDRCGAGEFDGSTEHVEST